MTTPPGVPRSASEYCAILDVAPALHLGQGAEDHPPVIVKFGFTVGAIPCADLGLAVLHVVAIDVPEDEPGLYFRTAPVFQTDAPQHRWLAEHQFLGLARDEGGQVCIRVYLLL